MKKRGYYIERAIKKKKKKLEKNKKLQIDEIVNNLQRMFRKGRIPKEEFEEKMQQYNV